MGHRSAAATVLGAAYLAATLAGSAAAQENARTPDNNPPANWPAATIVLAPSPPAPDGSETVWSWVSGAGMVEASRRTTAGIGKPLPAVAGPNKVVEPCRLAAWGDAAKLGARDIEAASAGTPRKDRWGRVTAPVNVRVTYRGLFIYEVREGVMSCTIDKNGEVVGAGQEDGSPAS